jgi:uncharacterized protein YaaN involved in tellurite resistance
MEGSPNNINPINITPINLDITPTPAPGTTTPVKLLDKEGNVDLTNISATEVQKYSEVAKALDPKDVNSILNYGTDVQASMEKYSNNFLTSVRTYNSGEVGLLINDLLTELNYIDVDELNQNAFTSFISHIPLC